MESSLLGVEEVIYWSVYGGNWCIWVFGDILCASKSCLWGGGGKKLWRNNLGCQPRSWSVWLEAGVFVGEPWMFGEAGVFGGKLKCLEKVGMLWLEGEVFGGSSGTFGWKLGCLTGSWSVKEKLLSLRDDGVWVNKWDVCIDLVAEMKP